MELHNPNKHIGESIMDPHNSIMDIYKSIVNKFFLSFHVWILINRFMEPHYSEIWISINQLQGSINIPN